MNITQMSNLEKMNLAHETSDKSLLDELSEDFSFLVRRVVARNHHTDRGTLERLAEDVTETVSYMATMNPNCTVQRSFANPISVCSTCTLDERTRGCESCPHIGKRTNL